MPWHQSRITLPPCSRGFHLVTDQVEQALPMLREFQIGLLHLFLLHTSASLTINENADRDVRRDLEAVFQALAPETFPYEHTIEGPDDMPAHVKAALIGNSLCIPIRAGRLVLGTWQGIYLCEHRQQGGSRSLVATIQGERG